MCSSGALPSVGRRYDPSYTRQRSRRAKASAGRGSTLDRPTLGKDDQLLIDGEIMVVIAAEELPGGFNLVVRTPSGAYRDAFIGVDEAESLRLTAGDGSGRSDRAIAALWALWMQREIPRIRSAVMATRPLRAFAHQDEAVFDAMLPEARLRDSSPRVATWAYRQSTFPPRTGERSRTWSTSS